MYEVKLSRIRCSITPSTNAPCYYHVDHDMRVTEIAVTVAVAIMFLRLREKSVWSITVRQADKK